MSNFGLQFDYFRFCYVVFFCRAALMLGSSIIRVVVRSVPFSRQRPRGRIDRLNSGDRRRSVTVVYRLIFCECSPPGAPGGFSCVPGVVGWFGQGGVTTTPPLVFCVLCSRAEKVLFFLCILHMVFFFFFLYNIVNFL